ncbi:PAX-interacting protein 1-like [Xiphophorus maculatus]|uniref:PAX-interacting protein 1-like n=1 Tax=Xiphophorus maculatus TaxID=8083 RepID=UPI000C6DC2DB|nr:PAX-interacting protein 1-like [Xiphophorus maculatus]
MAKQNNELLQRITTLEDIEQKEYKDMGAALENVQENVKSLQQCINQVKDFQRRHQLVMSPDLVQAEGMFTSIWQRIQRIAGFHQSQHAETRSALQQERESLEFLWESSSFQNTAEATEERNNSQSTERNQQQNQNQSKTSIISHFFSRQKTATNTETQEQKSDLKMEEEKHLQRIYMIEKNQQEQHQHIRDDLNQVGKEMTELQLRIHHIETTQRFEIRMKEMAGELQATR